MGLGLNASSVFGIYGGSLAAVAFEQQIANTQGGTFTAGALRLRTLNQLRAPAGSGFSLAANLLTVPPGEWLFMWSAPAYRVNGHFSELLDVPQAAGPWYGTTERASSTDTTQTRSHGFAWATVRTPTAFGVYHICATTFATSGFGIAANIVVPEVYTILAVIKFKS